MKETILLGKNEFNINVKPLRNVVAASIIPMIKERATLALNEHNDCIPSRKVIYVVVFYNPHNEKRHVEDLRLIETINSDLLLDGNYTIESYEEAVSLIETLFPQFNYLYPLGMYVAPMYFRIYTDLANARSILCRNVSFYQERSLDSVPLENATLEVVEKQPLPIANSRPVVFYDSINEPKLAKQNGTLHTATSEPNDKEQIKPVVVSKKLAGIDKTLFDGLEFDISDVTFDAIRKSIIAQVASLMKQDDVSLTLDDFIRWASISNKWLTAGDPTTTSMDKLIELNQNITEEAISLTIA